MYYRNYARIRDELGVNDSWVASRSGVAQTTLTEWKKTLDGDGYTPKLDKLRSIASVLGVTLDELIKEEP